MKIHLPNSVWIGNIDHFLKTIDNSDETCLEISSHEEWVSVHPVVLSMVVALGKKILGLNGKIRFQKMTAKSSHYLERMEVFSLLRLDSEIKITKHDSTGRFIPIQIITNSQELDRFITEIIPLIHKEPDKVDPLKYVITELVRNVLEHAHTQQGAVVSAQYYEKSNTIRLGIADTGIGLKESLKIYAPKDNINAISLALTPGVTGTTKSIGGTGENAGAGLFFIKSIAKFNRDFFMIYSGDAMYKLLKNPKHKNIKLIADPLQEHCSYSANYPHWQGTVVGIDICLNDHSQFTELLDLIRKFYRDVRKQKTKEKFKRPRFI